MLTREIRCSNCGGRRLAPRASVYMFCDFCNCLIGIDDRAYDLSKFDTVEALRSAIHPSDTEQRFRQLGDERNEAVRAGDRAHWALIEEERMTLWSVLHPESVDPHHRTGVALKRWVKMSVVCAEIVTFDPDAKAANAKFLEVSMKLSTPDGRTNAVAIARQMLAAAQAYLRCLEDKTPPEVTAELGRNDIGKLSSDMVRAFVRGYASVLEAGQVEKIELEVLGARRVRDDHVTCESCGATLGSAEISAGACPFCQAPVRVSNAAAPLPTR